MWTFFRDQILCPLNGGVPLIDVSQESEELTLLNLITWRVHRTHFQRDHGIVLHINTP